MIHMLKDFFKPHTKRYRMILEELRGRTVLDFGGSEGELHSYLIDNYDGKIISVDIAGKPDVRHDLNKFPYPFKSNYADTIVAGEIIEHLERPIEFLKECHRILKKEGVLILTTPIMFGLQYLTNKLFLRLGTNSPHLYAWNIDMLENIVRKIGFKIKISKLIVNYWSYNLFYRVLAYFFKIIRPTIFITASKNSGYYS